MSNARNSVKKLKNYISASDFATLGDALAAWEDGDVSSTLYIAPGDYAVTTGLTVAATVNHTKSKTIIAYGARFVSTSSSHALKITVEGTGKLWRGLSIQGLAITGGVDSIIIEGGNPASSEWIYASVFRDIRCEDFTGDGFTGEKGFFESQLYSCVAWAATGNVTGFGFVFDNSTHGTVSSIDLYSLNTRGGLHGLYTASPVSNVNTHGGTFLGAYEEGIRYALAIGSSIISPHVEDNWTSATGVVRAGIRISGRDCAVVAAFGIARNAPEQNYTLYAYAISGDIVVSGGESGGTQTKFGYYDCDVGTGAIVSNGVNFTKAGGKNAFAVSTATGVDLGSLKLANVDLASASTIDWYLEGTFTPTMTLGGGATGMTYSSQTGVFTRCGRVVTFYMGVALSAIGSSTGSILIEGLPYASDKTVPVSLWFDSLAAGSGANVLQGYINSASTNVSLHTLSGTITTLSDTHLTNTSVIRVSGSYSV